MKERFILSMFILSIIAIIFIVMVPKYPDVKNADIRTKNLTEAASEESVLKK